MESISRGRQLERLVREQQQQLQGHGGASRCIFPKCSQPALFWCDQCEGNVCAAHDRDFHPEAAAAAASSAVPHRRTPISERADAQQAKMAAQLAANGANLRAELLKTEEQTDDKNAAVEAHLAAEMVRVERDVLQPIRARLARVAAAKLAVKSLSAEIAPLSDTELFKYKARINELVGPAVPPDGLLAALSAERRSDFERFLQIAGVSLVSRQCG
jgi:hypothetical protein